MARRGPVFRSPATPVALAYAVLAGLWILLSDRALPLWFDGDEVQRLQTVKGWLFVAVTSVLLWVVLHGYWKVRARAEKELLATQWRLEATLENVNGVVFRLERPPGSNDWHIAWVSPGASRLLGRSPQQVAAHGRLRFADILHPEDRSRVLQTLRAGARSQGSFALDLRVVTPSGETRHAWCKARALPEPHGPPRAIEGFLADTTRVKLLERQLLHAQRLESLGQLAAGIAHDFNGVLTVMLGYAELARAKTGPDHPRGPELVEDLDEIRDAAERGTALTRQLLAFGRRQPRTETVLSIHAFLERGPSLLRPFLGARIALRVLREGEAVPVRVDASQIEQILVNLAVNARDAMGHGGELTLRSAAVHVDDPLAEGLGELPPGTYALLEVSDTGDGMDEATLARIFEPFFTTKPEERGTGLGLSVVYGIVEQSGGAVTASSEPGVGTVFRIYLPAVEVPSGGRPAEASGHPATLAGRAARE